MKKAGGSCPASVTDYRLLTTSGRWIERRNSKVKDPGWLMLTGTGLSMGSTMLARREVFDEVGFYDPATFNRTDDWDWFLRYRARFPLLIVPVPLTRYTGSHRANFEVERKAIRYIWDKHGARLRAEGGRAFGTFRAAYGWKMARVDFYQGRLGACFLKLAGIALTWPLDAVKYARIVLGDLLPWGGEKERSSGSGRPL
jgi:GT2 family glycosyltransferase